MLPLHCNPCTDGAYTRRRVRAFAHIFHHFLVYKATVFPASQGCAQRVKAMSRSSQQRDQLGIFLSCLALSLLLARPAGTEAGATDTSRPTSGCYPESAGCRLYGDCCHYVPDRKAATAPGLECVDAAGLGIYPPAATNGAPQPGSVLLIQTCTDDSHPEADACRSNQGQPRSLFDPHKLPAMSADDGLLFRSTHCARCNGRTRLLRPLVSVQCELQPLTLPNGTRMNMSMDEPRVTRYLQNELQSGRDLPMGCMVATRFPGRELHVCEPDVVESCTNTSASEADRRMCEDGGISLVHEDCRVFRNAACLGCNGLECGWGAFGIMNHGGVLSNVVNFWIPLNEDGQNGRSTSLVGVGEEPFDIGSDDFDGPRWKPHRNSSGANYTNGDGELAEDAAAQSFRPQHLVLIGSYSVSILSLILLLAVYAVMPHLRNRAGQLLMSHAASVLAMQAVQLLSMCAGHLLGSGCAALHFLFFFCLISAFVWAFLFGWDLLRTFSSLLHNSVFKPSRYGRFALIGWGLPTVLTAVLIGLHLGIGLLDASRGCRYRPDRVAFMIGLSFTPLLATVLFNITIVCLLAAQLVKTYRETRSAGQSSAAKLCVMTAKVSVIMGVAWLPYFLITLVDGGLNTATAGFAGEFLCSLHGLFLAVGFTGNRRVRARLSKMTSSVLKTSSSSDAVSGARMVSRQSQDIARSQGPLLRASADRSSSTPKA